MHSDGRVSHGFAPLYEEHLLLGAQFESASIVRSYAGGTARPSLLSGTVLSDVSDICLLLFSGASAHQFASIACAGDVLVPGQCAFEAVLTGDGSLASVPLLARTGEYEYVAADLSSRADVLSAWLSFLSNVTQDGVAPFAGLSTEDASEKHAALLLAGPQAPEVLQDYLGDEHVPSAGQVEACMLDHIPCIVLVLPLADTPCYVILVPPVHAVALWRSLLSFTCVTPIGREAVRDFAHDVLPWSTDLATGDTVRIDAERLSSFGLLRDEQTFVGARGLHETVR